MNKTQFIEELCKRLRNAPADEAQRTVNFYVEAIDDRIEDGMSEEEAVAAVGSIDDIVREILGDSAVEEKVEADTDGGEGGPVKKNYVIDPAGVTAVNVTETNGDVTVRRSPDGKIHVRVTEDRNVGYNVTKAAGVVTVAKQSAKSGFLNLGFGLHINFQWNDGAVTVELPDDIAPALSVKTGSGDIDVGIRAAASLSLGTGSGDIEVSDLSTNEAELSAASGDIEATGLTGDSITISTVSGDQELKRMTASGMKLNSVSGDVNMKEAYVDRKLIVKTVSGDIGIEMGSPLEVGSVESTSGDIELELYGPESAYSFNLRSISGDVQAPMGNDEAANAIRVRTASGDIDISCEV